MISVFVVLIGRQITRSFSDPRRREGEEGAVCCGTQRPPDTNTSHPHPTVGTEGLGYSTARVGGDPNQPNGPPNCPIPSAGVLLSLPRKQTITTTTGPPGAAGIPRRASRRTSSTTRATAPPPSSTGPGTSSAPRSARAHTPVAKSNSQRKGYKTHCSVQNAT